MNGRTEAEIISEREAVVEHIKKDICPDAQILDTYFTEPIESKNVPLKCLAKSIDFLAESDLAYFCKGWENARGCRFENEIAIAYGITVCEDYR